MSLTELERDVLLAIYDSDYQDGCRGIDTIGNLVWSEEGTLWPKLAKGKQISAIISQLVQKGYVEKGSKDTVALTQEGYNELFPRKEPDEQEEPDLSEHDDGTMDPNPETFDREGREAQ